jgi:hypothetical protein
MPDSFGKRNRDRVKASKAAAREERRVARNQRQRGETSSVPDDFEPGLEPVETTDTEPDETPSAVSLPDAEERAAHAEVISPG